MIPKVQANRPLPVREFVLDLVREASKDERAISTFGFTNWLSFLNEVDTAITYGGKRSDFAAIDDMLIIGATDKEQSAQVADLLRQTGPSSPMAYARKSFPDSNATLNFSVRVIPNKYLVSMSPVLRTAKAWVQGLLGETVMVIPQGLAERFILDAQVGDTQPYRNSPVSILGHELSHTG